MAALADAEDIPLSEMKYPPLYEVVDVLGVEHVFFRTNTDENARQGTGTVEFLYAEYLVKVRSNGWIQVYEPSEIEQV